MPVSPQGYESWVEMEGTKLEEFKVEEALNVAETTCYIPCEAGKEFSVVCTVPAHKIMQANHSIHVELDGKPVVVSGNTIRQRVAYDNMKLTFSADYFENYARCRNFQFGNLELTDDEAYYGEGAMKYGQIVVKICTVAQYVQRSAACIVHPNDQKEDYRIHEKAKKGLAHCVKFGEMRPAGPTSRLVLKAIGSQVVHRFVFNYRHMDLLVADGIAPSRKGKKPLDQWLSSGSASTSGKRKVDVKEEDGVESKRVKREPGGRSLGVIDLTQSADDDAPSSSTRVKKEKKPFVSGEVIDLTL